MFREKYKNANRCIDSENAYERVQKKLEEVKRPKIVWQQIASMVACLVICVAGISVYEMRKPSKSETDNNIIAPASEIGQMARIYEPEQDMAGIPKQESGLSDMSITEESTENFERIINDGAYQKREINGAVILEKSEDSMYECWVEMDGRIIKISATDMSQSEKEEIISSILK